jgi:sugar-specific transcriptional regulator TrmB
MRKVDKILKENEQLKGALNKFKSVLEEAAVTNVNLGQIIKLISENSTTKDEKQEIIARFGKEAKTVEQSKHLYESISRELKRNNTMNINEEKQFTANNSKMINETQIYKSQDIMESLDLMHRLCK